MFQNKIFFLLIYSCGFDVRIKCENGIDEVVLRVNEQVKLLSGGIEIFFGFQTKRTKPCKTQNLVLLFQPLY